MKNITKVTIMSNFDSILKKVKRLKIDTVYSYKILGKSSDKLRVYISRLADRGVIVISSRGRFYKPSSKVLVRRSSKTTALDKSLFTNDLFWNVRDGFRIDTKHLIRQYLINYTQDDLMGLYTLFGYSRLIEENLKLYKNTKDINYQRIKEMLMQFERWRLNL